jgi:ATP-binding cassette subfamily B protein
VLQRLPQREGGGLQTPLGEGGALLSGGEGQRVRLGRAMLQDGVRLALLDEPFRGLDREQRRSLLAASRRWWADSTLLCVTHDVGDTLDFTRVLVVDDGRIVEDGAPSALAAQDSHYARLLQAEAQVRREMWHSEAGNDAAGPNPWRRLRIEAGLAVNEAAA